MVIICVKIRSPKGIFFLKPWGKEVRILYGNRLVTEREIYKDWEILEVDHNRLCSYEMLQGVPFMFISVKDRILIQLQLLTLFLKIGGQLRKLAFFWMEVGILTGNASSTSDLSRIQ